MKQFSLLFVAILLLIAGCNKPLVKYNSNFEGTWFSVPVYNTTYSSYISDQLTFSGNDGSYFVDCKDTCAPVLCNCSNSISGKAEVNKQRTLIRIRGTINKTFTLDAEPYQNSSGVWMMEIDKKTYIKQ